MKTIQYKERDMVRAIIAARVLVAVEGKKVDMASLKEIRQAVFTADRIIKTSIKLGQEEGEEA